MAIALRADFDAAKLRVIARQSKDATQTRRLLALSAIYDGATRTQAAQLGGVTLQIVRDWVVRFNAEGPDGLVNRKGLASLRSLTAGSGLHWCRCWRADRSRQPMVWCAGA